MDSKQVELMCENMHKKSWKYYYGTLEYAHKHMTPTNRGGNFGYNPLTQLEPNMKSEGLDDYFLTWTRIKEDPTTQKLNGMNTGWSQFYVPTR